jgi:hypothetical protein
MRVISILRAGTLALALGAAVTSVAPAFAGSVGQSSQSQIHQNSNTGPYDGPAWQAAKNAWY